MVFPILVFPYIARILGPQGLGHAHFALQFSKWFITTASLGIPIYGLREVAKCKHNPEALNKLVSELLVLNFFTGLISTLIYAVVIVSMPEFSAYNQLFWIAGIQVVFGFLAFDWLFYGLEDFKTITIRSLVVRVVTVCFLLWKIQTPDDVFPYLLISILSITAANLWNLFYALRTIKFTFKGLVFKPHLNAIFTIFLINVCITMYTVFDTVWVGFLSTTMAVGLYTSATKLCKISIPLVSSLGTVLMPKSAQKFAANEHNPQHLQTSFNFIVDMAVPVAVGLILLSPEFLEVFSGAAFLDAVWAMRILSILPFCIGLSNLFGMQILAASGNDKLLLLGVAAGMVINITLNVLLVPFWAHTGAALAIAITELSVTMITYYLVQQKFTIRFDFSRVLKTLIVSLVFVPVIGILHFLGLPHLWMLLMGTSACLGIYVYLQYVIFKNEFITTGVETLKTKLGF